MLDNASNTHAVFVIPDQFLNYMHTYMLLIYTDSCAQLIKQ